MDESYILYPEAMEKLTSSGIVKRVGDFLKSEDSYLGGYFSDEDVMDEVRAMKSEGLFGYIPEEERKVFMGKLGGIFNKPKEHLWRTNRFGVETTQQSDRKHLLPLSGYWSSLVLKPEEIFDYRKFGFDNLTDFTGSVGAFIQNSIASNLFSKGYNWESQLKDGRVISSQITGDINLDLRVLRKDITPYETINPLGEQVHFRPEMHEDNHGLYPYHSTEDSFLGAIIQWVDQCGINSKSLEGKAKETIEWTKSLGQRVGAATECFYGAEDPLRTMSSLRYGLTIPKISEEGIPENPSRYGLLIQSGAFHTFYVDFQDNLVVTTESKNTSDNPNKPIRTKFAPEEADHLIKGLLFQAASGLGRTSAEQLIGILNYRFSPEYEEQVNRNS